VNLSYTGTSVELLHVRSSTPGVVLNPSYLIDGKPMTRQAPDEPKTMQSWAFNQTLLRFTGLTNAEHKLEVHLSQHDQLFVGSFLYSLRKELMQILMDSSTT